MQNHLHLARTIVSRLLGAALLVHATALASQDITPAKPESAVRVPALPPAEFDEKLAIGGEEIDARKLRSRMTVEVFVNQQGPYKFVVDSGADTSVVGERIAARLGLPEAPPVLLHAMTESKVVDRVEVDALQLGPTVTNDLFLPVLDERNIGGDGMIGLDALVRQRLMMDFKKRIITVEDGLTPAPVLRNEIVVTARLKRGQLILTQVRAVGQRVDAVIDTGTEVTIGNMALREKLRKRRPKSFRTVEIFGVTGAKATIDFAVIPELKLGPVHFRNVPIAFADVPPFEVFGLKEEPALLLGTDLMETFRRVSLDFHKRKVRFQLTRCQAQLTRIRTTGTASRLGADPGSACE